MPTLFAWNTLAIASMLSLLFENRGAYGSTSYPWTYDNDLFGGPDFWGLVSKQWKLCSTGKLQSPINIDPSVLVYDPKLPAVEIDRKTVDAVFENTGQLPVLTLNESATKDELIYIKKGSAYPYRYRLHHIVNHFGRISVGEKGSEHTVGKERFPAEIQLMAYNIDLYENYTDAMTQPHGLLAVAIIVDIGQATNSELRRLTLATQSIKYKGTKALIRNFNPYRLMPPLSSYVTYEGSLTFPGCYETVTWIIMNNPIYITKDELEIWDTLRQGISEQQDPTSMAHNYRPLKPTNGRLVRTNISLRFTMNSTGTCNNKINVGYKFNPKRKVSLARSLQQQHSARLRINVFRYADEPQNNFELDIRRF